VGGQEGGVGGGLSFWAGGPKLICDCQKFVFTPRIPTKVFGHSHIP